MTTLKIRDINKKPLFRELSISREHINEEVRTVELAFSSEQPVERWFGEEILDHSPSSVRLGRLNNNAAVLVDHDRTDHVAVVENARIDTDRRGRVTVRFGKGQRASEIFDDIVDGIRTSVSVGYMVHEMILEKERKDALNIYRINDWEPFEVSIVSVPADDTVGIGRAAENQSIEFKENKMSETETEEKPTPPAAAEPVDVRGIEKTAIAAERERVTEINALSDQFPELAKDLREYSNAGKSLQECRDFALEKLRSKPLDIPPVNIDLSEKEQREYSIVRAIDATAKGDWEEAGLEREISQNIAKQLGRSTDGVFVPTSVRMGGQAMRAPLVAGVDGQGGHTIQTDVMSLIEMLRNNMMVRQMGARFLSGLDGDLSFPRQTASSVLSWVGENPGSDVADTDATFDQVALTPKTAQSSTAYSRQMLAQSTLDVEAFVRGDLAQVNALGLDLAAILGTGASNQPLGILNTTGIGTVVGGTNGAAPEWSHIVKLETEVASDNADIGSLGYLTNAKVRGKLKETEKAANTALFVWGDGTQPGFGTLNGYRAGVSNQIPSDLVKGTANDASAIIFGNWADLLIGEWGTMELIVDPYALKKQGLVEVTSFMMVDIAVRHPESFAVMKDLLTS